MLLKLKNIKGQFAIGLRWAVDTRQGIEQIQFSSNLNYGILLSVKDKSYRRLKLAALTDDTYDKSVCLAGLLSRLYKQLIFVHRLSDTMFWLCIIKNGEVWSGVDVNKATAGDYIGEHAEVQKIIDKAMEEFEADQIDIHSHLICTDTAFSEFPGFNKVDLFNLINQARRYRNQFIIRYLEPSKVVRQKIILVALLIIVLSSVGYFIYRKHLLHAILHQQEVENARRAAAQLKAENNYFHQLEQKIQQQWGYAVLDNVMKMLSHLPLQSEGWELSSINYLSSQPKAFKLNLTRTNYGTLNSFLYAYTPEGKNGKVDNSNNAGNKTINITDITLNTEANFNLDRPMITQKIPKNLYALISFMQTHQEMFNFKQGKTAGKKYGVQASSFQMTGSALWQLIQLQMALKAFPTLVINKIDFRVANYDMSWTLEGEIYA